MQDSSASGYTVTWPTSVDWPSATAPTLTATTSVDYFVFITHDGGTTYYGFTAGQVIGMRRSANKLIAAAAGNAGDDPVYVDDVFAATAFEGNSGSTSGKHTNVNLEVPLTDYTGTSLARFKGDNQYVRHGGMNNAGEVLSLLQLNEYDPSTDNKLIKIKLFEPLLGGRMFQAHNQLWTT